MTVLQLAQRLVRLVEQGKGQVDVKVGLTNTDGRSAAVNDVMLDVDDVSCLQSTCYLTAFRQWDPKHDLNRILK